MTADDEIPEGAPVQDGEPADGEVAQGQMAEGSGPPEEGQDTGGEIEGEQEGEEPSGCACFSSADDEKGLRNHLGDLLVLSLGLIVLLASARSAAWQK